jgi:hypothetical protein
MLLRRPSSSCLLVLSLAFSAGAYAGPHGHGQGQPAPMSVPQQQPPRQRAVDPLSDSVRRVERSTRGQVLSAERVPYDGRDVNRIKVIDDRGRVRVYMDDPTSREPAQPEPPTRGDDD